MQPRGLRRASAAAYLGISPSMFDKQRAAGNIPAPKILFGVTVWDRHALDLLFDGTHVDSGKLVAANDNASDYWDRACATASRNT